MPRRRVTSPRNWKVLFWKNQKRGHGGIEPPTSPTLKENHTTRPMPHTSEQLTPKKTSAPSLERRAKQNYKGAAGIEPATPGSAIPCSTAELCTRGGVTRQSTSRDWYGHGSKSARTFYCSRVSWPCSKKQKVLPGLEPGSKDSKSLVITITL